MELAFGEMATRWCCNTRVTGSPREGEDLRADVAEIPVAKAESERIGSIRCS